MSRVVSTIEREVVGMEFPDEVWAELVEVTVEEYEKVLGRERARIAALEALCEELLDEVSLLNERAPMAEYRARLAQLKGAG